MKITIFHHSGKYSVKLEGGGNEQTLKFREDEFNSEAEVKAYLEGKLIHKIDQHFYQLSQYRADYHAQIVRGEDLEEIV